MDLDSWQNILIKFLIKIKKYNIVVSTSGDTGSAIASAFSKCKNINVTILYPNNRISKIQEIQITTNGNNVISYGIDTSFDTCQTFVKKILSNEYLKNKLNLISANSINIARLLPQTLYYFYSYSILKKEHGDKINNKLIFVVPCGIRKPIKLISNK